jgi:hypothetical protein
MKTKLLGLIAACALLGSTVGASASPYIVTLEEVGSNVVANGSGSIDTTILSFAVGSGNNGLVGPLIAPDVAAIYTGALGQITLFVGPIIGPTTFGSGGVNAATGGTGDMVGVNGYFKSPSIMLPFGYSSDSALTDTANYALATFASLGVTPGTYVWTWGTGADQSYTLIIGATPLPAALPLFATGLGVLGLLGWRRKRKAAAVAA